MNMMHSKAGSRLVAGVLLVGASVVLCVSTGCEERARQPTIYGKGRDMAHGVEDQIQERDAETGRMADELMGN